MTGNWRRAAAGLAVLAALTWAFARRAEAPLPPAPAPAPAVVAPAAPSAPARPKIEAETAAPAKRRAPGLSDPGKALGGTPPARGDSAAPSAR